MPTITSYTTKCDLTPAVHTRVAGCCAETLRAVPRPTQGPALRPRHPPPSDQEAHQQPHEEAANHHKGRLTGPARLQAIDLDHGIHPAHQG
jgi:hypothetical protein